MVKNSDGNAKPFPGPWQLERQTTPSNLHYGISQIASLRGWPVVSLLCCNFGSHPTPLTLLPTRPFLLLTFPSFRTSKEIYFYKLYISKKSRVTWDGFELLNPKQPNYPFWSVPSLGGRDHTKMMNWQELSLRKSEARAGEDSPLNLCTERHIGKENQYFLTPANLPWTLFQS